MKEISHQWNPLLCKIEREMVFDFPLFKVAFEEPFKLLQPFSTQQHRPKAYMELYLVANKFAGHFVTGISAEHDAAGELALAMLWDCGIGCCEELAEGYFDEEIQQYISYMDIDSAVTALAEKYVQDYD